MFLDILAALYVPLVPTELISLVAQEPSRLHINS